jgi:hypothetical protein
MADDKTGGGFGWILIVGIAAFFIFFYRGGCSLIDQQYIRGTWLRPDGSKAVSFYGDGTCDLFFPLATRRAKYQVLDDKRLKITTPGLIWGETEEEVGYELSGNELTITTRILGQEVSGKLRRQ